MAHHAGDVLVVERLAHLLELHLEPRVDLLKLAARHVADLPPRVARAAVAALQLDNLIVRHLLEGLVVVEDLLRVPVELLQVGDRRWLRRIVWEHVLQVADQHAKLRAPVTDVVNPLDAVATELEEPADGVADDRGAEVAYVHLLGHVGRREVNDNIERGARRRQHAVCHDRVHAARDPLLREEDVDEARAGDVELGDDPLLVVGLHVLRQLGCNIPRRLDAVRQTASGLHHPKEAHR
mmetsp:Transcript_15804/g.41602  ORF Transcript_15804/g.41602 Transcript_15804/m.41602 type:complete len:238 (+) Transcript_15804:1255-1968(+)